MASVQIRDLPDELYNELTRRAKAENRSLAQEAVYLLKKSLDIHTSPKTRRRELIEQIRKNPRSIETTHSPEDLVRGDRER